MLKKTSLKNATNKNKGGKFAALATIAALALTGCAADGGETSDNAGGSDGAGNGVNTDPITMGITPGWDEGVAVSYLWKAILEEKGYNVDIKSSDVAPIYIALAAGDYDLNMDVWLPITHADYLEKYGKDIVDLGSWNDDAILTIAVNEDSPVQSLADLAENADVYGNKIIGIEPGAGLTRVTNDEAIPTYGLEGMEFITSSTGAMLAELQGALNRGDNIVVTLWQPHWAYGAFPIRNLEDPEGAMGGAEGIHAFSRTGFDTDYPEVNAWLKDFTMDSDKLHSLENAMFGEYDGDNFEPIVADWIKDNQDWVDSLTQ